MSYSREHRPDLNQVMLNLIVEYQAGIPLRMKPLSGHSSDVPHLGQIVTEHITPLQTTDSTTSLVADSALYSAENRQTRGETGITWITRVPATVSAAQALLTQAAPQTMAFLLAGYRYHTWMSTYGRVPQRWVLCYSEHRRPQAQRLVNNHWLKQSAAEAKAIQQLCRTAYACAADVPSARTTFAQGLQATSLHEGTVHPTPRYRMRGRSSQDTPPARVVYYSTGALAASLAAHEALVAPQSCASWPPTNSMTARDQPMHC